METLPEEILTEILARLPLRNIYRFKSVNKTSKSLIESVYFRRHYVSLHKNSNSWSLTCGIRKEVISFYRCETWDLPEPLASLIPRARFYYSNGLVLIRGFYRGHASCFVGNPVLQEWIKIPPLPDGSSIFGLVTRVDEDGVVLSFKVVSLASLERTSLSVFLYSSETGLWTSKIIHCAHQIVDRSYVTVDGTIYYSNLFRQPGVVVAHDLYSESDQFRVIPLPDHNEDDVNKKRVLTTTSGRYLMCMRTSLTQKEETVLKVWRLNNDDDSWQLLSKTNLPMFIGDYVPTAMHPFDSDIVYVWSQQNRHTVSCNLRTKNNSILGDEYSHFMNEFVRVSVRLLQFMLPRWMEPMPRPPQIEMIDTTSLLSDPSLLRRKYKVRYV